MKTSVCISRSVSHFVTHIYNRIQSGEQLDEVREDFFARLRELGLNWSEIERQIDVLHKMLTN